MSVRMCKKGLHEMGRSNIAHNGACRPCRNAHVAAKKADRKELQAALANKKFREQIAVISRAVACEWCGGLALSGTILCKTCTGWRVDEIKQAVQGECWL